MTLIPSPTPGRPPVKQSSQDPVDEVCRILARVLTRIQAGQPSDAAHTEGETA